MKFEKLGNIATIKTGKYDVNHSTPDGEFVFYTCAYGQFKSPTYSFEGPAIILPGNGANVGEVFYYDGKFEAYQRTYVVQNFKADPNYIYAYFKAEWKKSLRNKQFGSATNYIRLNNLTDFSIPLPSLPDQLHIANILCKAENLIAQRKESIRLLDEFLKSTFLEMFGEPVRNEKGWEILALSDVCTKITDGTHDTPERLTQGVKYITGKHITPFNIDFDNSDYVTEEVHKEIYRRTNVEFDDVLYTNIGANVGTAARVNVNYEFSLKNVALLKHERKKVNANYLVHLLNLQNFKHRLLSLLSIGGAQKFLNLKSIGKIKIPVPPIELQNQFAQIVEKTEALKSQYRQSLQELENLYGSLSQRAFRGELAINKAVSV